MRPIIVHKPPDLNYQAKHHWQKLFYFRFLFFFVIILASWCLNPNPLNTLKKKKTPHKVTIMCVECGHKINSSLAAEFDYKNNQVCLVFNGVIDLVSFNVHHLTIVTKLYNCFMYFVVTKFSMVVANGNLFLLFVDSPYCYLLSAYGPLTNN